MIKVLAMLAAMLAGGVAMAQTAAVPEWPACEVRSDGWQQGGTATVTVRMRRDESCAVTTSPTNNRVEHVVATAPRNGEASAAGLRTVYRPRPGFTGTDVFVVRVAAAGLPPRFMTVNVEVR